jgi:TPR repeat protein
MLSPVIDAKTLDAAKAAIGPRYRKVMVYTHVVGGLLAGLLLLLSMAPSASAAETRRAFLIGIQRYSDGYIQHLKHSTNDAKDLAKDLEEVGFDKKNIKVAVDLSNRDAFEKEFSAFLNTIQPGDDIVFFFSGHGFGVELDQTNYLLFTDLKSPFTYAKSQLTEQERKNPDVVRLKIPQYLDAYQQNEIPNGISAEEIQRRLAEKGPKTVIMILDACRSLVQNDAESTEVKLVKRGNDSGSRLLDARRPRPGFLILYSASFGETALDSFGGNEDNSRNSLFTGMLRSELQRPGQPVIELGERIRLMVRSIAQNTGWQQEPELFYDHKDPRNIDDFYFVGSIGRERFPMSQNKCTGEEGDWEQIKDLLKRDLYERHIRRFDLCPHGTAELARGALAALALTSDDPIPVTAVASKSVTECDRLAASPLDGARPPEVPGVLTETMDADAAIAACNKAAADNPRVARYLFNLGRAYQKRGMQPGVGKDERKSDLTSARLAYEDATKRGYVSALNNLAVLDELDKQYEEQVDLLKRAAQQGHPLAMYNLGLLYLNGLEVPVRSGEGRDERGVLLARDDQQAAEWFAKAAGLGLVSAMVQNGMMLREGIGQPEDLEDKDNPRHGKKNPRRGVEWLQRAADAGSVRAMFELGRTYETGKHTPDVSTSIPQDYELALLWYGRAAEARYSDAQVSVAQMMERGDGLPNQQPEIAERYWRLAANGGNAFAEVEFADRLRRGLLLVNEEYGEKEIVRLLKKAMSQGSAQAAAQLAEIYRKGELGEGKNPLEAMKLAYHAIDLAVLSDPTAIEDSPYYEINAAHLLVEMAKNGEAIDAMGRPLLTPEEIDRLEHYYGAVDPATKEVKIRRLKVPVYCDPDHRFWVTQHPIWFWDWGRLESPTEFQIRDIERRTGCTYNQKMRRTFIDIFQQSKKNKVAFADLLFQEIQTSQGDPHPQKGDRAGHRRGQR